MLYDYQISLIEMLKKAGVTAVKQKMVDSVEQGFVLIESGYGIGLVPKHQKLFATDSVCFVPVLEEGCYMDVVLAWKTDNQNPNIQRFLGIVDRYLSNDQN